MMQRLCLGFLFLYVCACGGAPAAVAPAPAPAANPAVAVSAPAPDPEPSGPGRIQVGIVVDGEMVGGTVRLVSASGARVAEGPAGSSFEVEPGQYRAYAQITDASVLADTPERRGRDRITVGAGQTVQSDVEIGRALVRLTVTRGGRAVRRWRVELRPSGSQETVLEVQPSEEYLPITAGRYSAIVHSGGAEIPVDGLIFMPGARQQLPIRIQ